MGLGDGLTNGDSTCNDVCQRTFMLSALLWVGIALQVRMTTHGIRYVGTPRLVRVAIARQLRGLLTDSQTDIPSAMPHAKGRSS